MVIVFVLVLVSLSVVYMTPKDPGPRVRGAKIELDDILNRKFTPNPHNATWNKGKLFHCKSFHQSNNVSWQNFSKRELWCIIMWSFEKLIEGDKLCQKLKYELIYRWNWILLHESWRSTVSVWCKEQKIKWNFGHHHFCKLNSINMLMVYCMILWYCTACLILKMLLPFYCLDCGGQKIWIFVFMCINYNLAIWKEMFSRKLESPKWNYIYIYSKYNIVESKTILSQLNKA